MTCTVGSAIADIRKAFEATGMAAPAAIELETYEQGLRVCAGLCEPCAAMTFFKPGVGSASMVCEVELHGIKIRWPAEPQ